MKAQHKKKSKQQGSYSCFVARWGKQSSIKDQAINLLPLFVCLIMLSTYMQNLLLKIIWFMLDRFFFSFYGQIPV